MVAELVRFVVQQRRKDLRVQRVESRTRFRCSHFCSDLLGGEAADAGNTASAVFYVKCYSDKNCLMSELR
jgi:hypothetical protein